MTWDASAVKKNKNKSSAQDPLLAGELKTASQSIETMLTGFQVKIRDLNTAHNKLGSDEDNADFRAKIATQIQDATDSATKLRLEIKDFGSISVNFKAEGTRRDKQEAFQIRFQELFQKFQDVTRRIQDKQRLYIELANRRRQTMQSQRDLESQDITAEEQEQIKIDKKALAVKAETDYIAQVIDERKEQYDQVEGLMNDINQIAKDLNVNTAAQGEKLVRVDQNAAEALENAEKAHEEIVQAEKHQKKGGKYMKCILMIILFVIIGVAIIATLSLTGGS